MGCLKLNTELYNRLNKEVKDFKTNKTRILSVRNGLNIIGKLYIRLRILSIERRLATK